MNVSDFLAYHGVTENPFNAEEARHDPVFERLLGDDATHPDFAKILGRIDQPSTSIVFGEKGSGKTAIRLLIGRRIAEHNRAVASGQAPDGKRTLLVAYDDLNPVLDRFVKHRRRLAGDLSDAATEKLLAQFRLVDHQDAILSLAVTRLTDAVLGETGGPGKTDDERVDAGALSGRGLKRMPRRLRANLAVLAALYDQPADGSVTARWQQLRQRLRLGWRLPFNLTKWTGIVLAFAAVGLGVTYAVMGEDRPAWLIWALIASAVTGAALLAWWAWKWIALWSLARRIHRETPTIDRTAAELQRMLGMLRATDLAHQPWPIAQAGSDARYDLTRRLLDVLNYLGYGGMIVLVDRVDEPTLISGRAERMKSIIWPMLDNKFLQQQAIGVKLLLPIELRYLLQREPGDFFQEARLDKQNMVDRLTWSGATLYDLCSNRLRACRKGQPHGDHPASTRPIQLTDLFEEDVSRQLIIDALDQMHQPRDAFKFLYAVVQEHCRTVSADEASYRIPRLTLETVRRAQAQRVQELHRGLAPA